MDDLRPVILVAGTHAGNPPWIEDPLHPFQTMLARHGLRTARSRRNGLPFRWNTQLSIFGSGRWERESDRLVAFCDDFSELDFIMHSHGGQLGIFAARTLGHMGRKIRTFTTVGTPVRPKDVPAAEAVPYIRYWQHVFDVERDWIAGAKRQAARMGLGGLFGGGLTQRQFILPGVVNIGLEDIHHSRILNDPRAIGRWDTENLAGAIVRGPVARPALKVDPFTESYGTSWMD